MKRFWINERISKELLPHQFNFVDLLLKEIKSTTEQLEHTSDKDVAYGSRCMDLDRVQYIINSYVRLVVRGRSIIRCLELVFRRSKQIRPRYWWSILSDSIQEKTTCSMSASSLLLRTTMPVGSKPSTGPFWTNCLISWRICQFRGALATLDVWSVSHSPKACPVFLCSTCQIRITKS